MESLVKLPDPVTKDSTELISIALLVAVNVALLISTPISLGTVPLYLAIVVIEEVLRKWDAFVAKFGSSLVTGAIHTLNCFEWILTKLYKAFCRWMWPAPVFRPKPQLPIEISAYHIINRYNWYEHSRWIELDESRICNTEYEQLELFIEDLSRNTALSGHLNVMLRPLVHKEKIILGQEMMFPFIKTLTAWSSVSDYIGQKYGPRTPLENLVKTLILDLTPTFEVVYDLSESLPIILDKLWLLETFALNFPFYKTNDPTYFDDWSFVLPRLKRLEMRKIELQIERRSFPNIIRFITEFVTATRLPELISLALLDWEVIEPSWFTSIAPQIRLLNVNQIGPGWEIFSHLYLLNLHPLPQRVLVRLLNYPRIERTRTTQEIENETIVEKAPQPRICLPRFKILRFDPSFSGNDPECQLWQDLDDLLLSNSIFPFSPPVYQRINQRIDLPRNWFENDEKPTNYNASLHNGREWDPDARERVIRIIKRRGYEVVLEEEDVETRRVEKMRTLCFRSGFDTKVWKEYEKFG